MVTLYIALLGIPTALTVAWLYRRRKRRGVGFRWWEWPVFIAGALMGYTILYFFLLWGLLLVAAALGAGA